MTDESPEGEPALEILAGDSMKAMVREEIVSLEEGNQALVELKRGGVQGAKVLVINRSQLEEER